MDYKLSWTKVLHERGPAPCRKTSIPTPTTC